MAVGGSESQTEPASFTGKARYAKRRVRSLVSGRLLLLRFFERLGDQ